MVAMAVMAVSRGPVALVGRAVMPGMAGSCSSSAAARMPVPAAMVVPVVLPGQLVMAVTVRPGMY